MTSDVVDDRQTKRRAIMNSTLRSLHRGNLSPHHDSIGTSGPEFAASIVHYSERESNPVESGFPDSLRCRVPCIGGARDSPRAPGEASRRPSTSASRKRLLRVQATHRRQAERSKPSGAGNEGRTRHQSTRPNVRAGSPTLRTHPQLTEHRIGALHPQESRNNPRKIVNSGEVRTNALASPSW